MLLASIWPIMVKLDYCLVFKVMGNCSIRLSKCSLGMVKLSIGNVDENGFWVNQNHEQGINVPPSFCRIASGI